MCDDGTLPGAARRSSSREQLDGPQYKFARWLRRLIWLQLVLLLYLEVYVYFDKGLITLECAFCGALCVVAFFLCPVLSIATIVGLLTCRSEAGVRWRAAIALAIIAVGWLYISSVLFSHSW